MKGALEDRMVERVGFKSLFISRSLRLVHEEELSITSYLKQDW